MTIIKPSEYQDYVRFLILVFAVALVGGLVYIFTYNSLVDTRFQLKTLKEDIVKGQALNADLKNNIYKITDPANLGGLASEHSLVLERNPDYLNSNQWLSDSSL
ncbi:MAG: hypothetical protein KJI72_00825 [Patescibacteria group bacterium]|nr:hypothetical protein [Patescibacteria group bacterium]